jgi:hypothetical protein
VYEDPEPENSVYAMPVKFGFRLKPLSRQYVSIAEYALSGFVGEGTESKMLLVTIKRA